MLKKGQAEVAEEKAPEVEASEEIAEAEAEAEGKAVKDKSPMSNAITAGSTTTMQETARPRKR